MTLNCLKFLLSDGDPYLLPDADVSLSDQHSGVVNRLGESELEHLGLEPPLHEVLGLESQHVVELHLVLGQDPGPHQAAEQRIALKQSPGILLIQGEQLPGSGPDLGQTELDSPDLIKEEKFNRF